MQLKMFAPKQHMCTFCGVEFVPLSKDTVRMWAQEFQMDRAWLDSSNWAIERMHQENLKYCSPTCVELMDEMKRISIREEIRQSLMRKYR